MTQVIITTETAEEMKTILTLARTSKVKFKVVSIRRGVPETVSGQKTLKESVEKIQYTEDWILPGKQISESALQKMLDEAESEKGVDAKIAIQSINKALKKLSAK